ncbi:MAG: RNA 2',3'-cyclic phosphodiesterase [Nitrospinae bacterium]|nr:RNA 2',3'-cyclic phosphodiesterase [Nitrospinota bacterium]
MRDLRLFLAIDVPNSVREKITEAQSFYKTLNLDAAWVKPANMHLTVKFLGDTPSGLIPAIKDRMAEIAISTPPFSLTLGKMGVFPNVSRPRVLWIGLENREDHLGSLKTRVEKEMASLGFPPDKQKPVHHLTLGRIKSSKNREDLKKALQSAQRIEMDPFEISSIQLIKSELTPKGSIYTVQEEFVFTGSITRQ